MSFILSPQPTSRDIAILRELFHCRVMTLHQLSELIFDGRTKAATKRLRELKRRKLIAERPRLPQQKSILHITRQGYELLREQGGLVDNPEIDWEFLRKRLDVSPLTLQHELDVMSIRVSMEKAIGAVARLKIARFHTWPRLFQFRIRTGSCKSAWMRPDAFIHVQETIGNHAPRDHYFYVEVDRSTEALQVLQSKAKAYHDHFHTGGFARQRGQDREKYRQFPFRVIWIFLSEQRRQNAAGAFLRCDPPILNQAWLTTANEFSQAPLGLIWNSPSDYRHPMSDVVRRLLL